jgi:hypothetical protein
MWLSPKMGQSQPPARGRAREATMWLSPKMGQSQPPARGRAREATLVIHQLVNHLTHSLARARERRRGHQRDHRRIPPPSSHAPARGDRSDSQRAMVAAKWAGLKVGQPRKPSESIPPIGGISPTSATATRDEAGKIFDVGTPSIARSKPRQTSG